MLAARFLADRGVRIEARNVRVGRDEIDLVGTDDDDVRVAVEVKTARIGRPEDNLDERKETAMRRAASRLRPPAKRIDVVAVTLRPDGVTFRWMKDV